MILVVVVCVETERRDVGKHNKDNLFHTNAVIPHKTSQQARTRLVTTPGLQSLWYKHGLLPNIHVTSLLQLNKYTTSVNTLQSLQALHATFVALPPVGWKTKQHPETMLSCDQVLMSMS